VAVSLNNTTLERRCEVKVKMTPSLARAASLDAGNKTARANGGDTWNDEDVVVAAAVWRGLTEQQEATQRGHLDVTARY
jgi:hypothetical protein